MKTKYKELVVRRNKPCKCGCMGKDPQHRKSYTRIVKNILPLSGQTHVMAEDYKIMFDLIGYADMPWGRQIVVREVWNHEGKEIKLSWQCVRGY